MKLLVDTNIVLDFLLEREPFFHESVILFDAMDSGSITIYITPYTATDIFYIAKEHTQSIERAKQAIALALATLEICLIDQAILQLASLELNLASSTPEFEDAVEVACVLSQGLDGIVKRDADVSHPSVPILSVKEVIQRISTIS